MIQSSILLHYIFVVYISISSVILQPVVKVRQSALEQRSDTSILSRGALCDLFFSRVALYHLDFHCRVEFQWVIESFAPGTDGRRAMRTYLVLVGRSQTMMTKKLLCLTRRQV